MTADFAGLTEWDNVNMKTIRLKAGKERSLQRQHPWIFESAIDKGSADAGETVRVESHEGVFWRGQLSAPRRAFAHGFGVLMKRSALTPPSSKG